VVSGFGISSTRNGSASSRKRNCCGRSGIPVGLFHGAKYFFLSSNSTSSWVFVIHHRPCVVDPYEFGRGDSDSNGPVSYEDHPRAVCVQRLKFPTAYCPNTIFIFIMNGDDADDVCAMRAREDTDTSVLFHWHMPFTEGAQLVAFA
jgi:hypothetical protein